MTHVRINKSTCTSRLIMGSVLQQGTEDYSRGKQGFDGREAYHYQHGGKPGFQMQGPRLSQLKATSAGSSDSLLSQGKTANNGFSSDHGLFSNIV